MARPTYDSAAHEEAATRIAERHTRRVGRPDRTTADPHAILFADGCRSWLGYSSRDRAAEALADLMAGPTADLWAGANVVPIRRDGQVVRDRRTGLELSSYALCPAHREGGTARPQAPAELEADR